MLEGNGDAALCRTACQTYTGGGEAYLRGDSCQSNGHYKVRSRPDCCDCTDLST